MVYVSIMVSLYKCQPAGASAMTSDSHIWIPEIRSDHRKLRNKS